MEVQLIDFNNFTNFTSMVSTCSRSHISYVVLNNAQGSCIIDTGASYHMTFDFNLFSRTTSLLNPINVTLPDGSFKAITLVSDRQLLPTLQLHNVLLVPDFTCNLLLKANFLTDNYGYTIFYPTHCVF